MAIGKTPDDTYSGTQTNPWQTNQLAEDKKERRRPERYDPLQKQVAHGDLVIRKVANGYIIRRINANPAVYVPQEDMWLVEGDLAEAAKQLTAIHAAEVMRYEHEKQQLTIAQQSMLMSNGPAGAFQSVYKK